MNNGKTIFSQIMSNIPEREFKACVDRIQGQLQIKELYMQGSVSCDELCSAN